MVRASLARIVACCLLAPACLSSRAPAAEARPNILYIFTDDQSHRSVSCYEAAHDWVHTPEIDRLAEEGIRFRSAYIGTWCMPSRATQLTGLLQFGVQSMRMEGRYPGSTYDSERCPFWPRVLRESGYVTAQIGKWHTGRDAGFGRDWDLQAVWNRPRLAGRDAWDYYENPKLEFNGHPARRVAGYSTDTYTDLAVDFIRQRRLGESTADGKKPWFLWLCYSGVHGPYTPAERHTADYPDSVASTPTDIFPPRPTKPPHMRQLSRWSPAPDGSPIGYQSAVRKYHRAVRSLDEGVGVLLKALEESGQLDNTIIVFTSDQGFALGQHGLKEKWAPYDAALLAPLIFRLPGGKNSGAVCSMPVGGVDIVPTLLDFARVEAPWELHGHSLIEILRGERDDRPHSVLLPQTHDRYGDALAQLPDESDRVRKSLPWYVLIRRGPYKFVRYLVRDEGEELYNLRADPDELNNLISTDEGRPVAAELRAEMVDELRRLTPDFLAATGW